MHLGPEAMKMIGEGIAQDIAVNSATNGGNSWFAQEHEGTFEDDEEPPP